MTVRQSVTVPQLGKLAAGIVAGLGIGTLVSQGSVALPAVGTVPGLAVGTAGILLGGGLHRAVQRSTDDCGCGGNCRS